MLKHFDHVTVVVTDVDAAIRFFALLGFEKDKYVVISGEKFSRYMGVGGIEAEHVTLALKDAAPRCEVQLLHYRHPTVLPNTDIARLDRVGFNHICFAVDDIEGVIEKAKAGGIRLRNELMTFHDRKLIFLEGPEGITVELAEWQ
jgi:catechol 2,3-dioxygenase-like lactoylglutathione lyase family enzyme